ncbi:MAG: hypothetical protein JEZ06_12240 [Anaerolineaceae bacterium]|nr:hypothetical protein [Anaerolineaceae bacterium]
MSDSKQGYRSLFWPFLLVGVGVIWLLSNLGFIPSANLWALLRLWPLILIVMGLDILFGRRSPLIGAFIGFVAIAGIIFLLVAGPALGWVKSQGINTQTFSEPIEDVEEAILVLDLSSETTNVFALEDSENLIDSEFTLFGEMDFRVSGLREKTISIGSNHYEQWFPVYSSRDSLNWDIGLSNEVPWDISVDASSGKTDLNLRGILLDILRIDASSGRLNLILPESDQEYTVEIESSSGRIDVELPEETNLTIYLDGSSGLQSFDLPSSEVGIRVKVEDDGSGSVKLPGTEQMNGTGSWESDNYDDAEFQIDFIIEDVSSGNIVIE